MPVTCACTILPTAAHANEAIRAYVAGRRTWTRADLAELARLRAAWLEARRHEAWTVAA